MSRRRGAAFVLGIAVALLGGSIAWAVDNAGGWSWSGHAYAYGPAMMGLGYSTGRAAPVTGILDARRRAQAFASRLGLKTSEVLHFERNYYVKLVDGRDRNATEVLVDPSTGATSLEYGPAMMWNTRYGMMSGRLGSGMMSAGAIRSMLGGYGSTYGGMMGGGMMGGGMMGGGMMGGGSYGGTTGGVPGGTTPSSGSVSLARAHALAQRWLDANEPGTKVEPGGDAFPGYYTLETLRDGRVDGMISVNASTGAVWPHWWHGRFLGMAE